MTASLDENSERSRLRNKVPLLLPSLLAQGFDRAGCTLETADPDLSISEPDCRRGHVDFDVRLLHSSSAMVVNNYGQIPGPFLFQS